MSVDPVFPPVRDRCPPWTAVVFACTLFVRLCTLLLAAGSLHILPSHGDMKFYGEWAQRIDAGIWTDHRAFYGLPGYAYWLALVFGFAGFQPFLVSLIQQVVDAGTATLLFRLGERAFVCAGYDGDAAERRCARWVGVLAAVGWTLCTSAQAYSMVLMPTCYLVCAFWFVVWWVLRPRGAERRPSVRAFAGLGLLMGAVAMMVANILFLVPLVLAAIWRRAEWRPFPWRARAGASACLVGGVLAGASPCALHNYLVVGEPVFLSAHGGINFYLGNNARANGYPFIPAPLHSDQAGLLRDSIYWAERMEGRPLKRVEVSAFWAAQARDYIAKHPGDWLRLLGKKLVNFCNFYPYDDVAVIAPMRADGVLLPGVGFGWFVVFGLPGALLAIWRRPRARWIVAAVALHVASLLPVFVTERYRLASAPGLLLVGSYGIVEAVGALLALVRRWSFAGRSGRFAAGGATYAAVLAGAVFVALRPVPADLRGHDLYNGVLADIDEKRYDHALEGLERLVAMQPNSAETYFAMGNAWLGKNDDKHAIACYCHAIQLDPRHHRAYNNLGVMAYQQKDYVTAAGFLATSLTIDAEDAKTNFLLANARKELDDRPGARLAAAEAVRLRPDQEEYRRLRDELADPDPDPDPARDTASAAPAANPIP